MQQPTDNKKGPFKNWLQPILWVFLTLPVFLVSIPVGNGLFSTIAAALFLLNILWMVVSMVVLLFRKEWMKSFYTLLFLFSIATAIGLLIG